MTTTNPIAAPVHSELGRAARPACGSDGCPTCPQINVPIPVPIGEAVTAGSIFATNIFTGTIKAPEPELTVKQAAKAYRKAEQARVAAVEAHKAAEQAERDTRAAMQRASRDSEAAREALEKAATR
jgi:hypothetical protein